MDGAAGVWASALPAINDKVAQTIPEIRFMQFSRF
jgi:hypothetical protein